jgi:EpsI family protein
MRKLIAFAPALILGSAYAFVLHTHSQAALPLVQPLTSVLSQLAGYRVEDQHISDEERRVAGMSDYVARLYWRDSNTVAFTTLVTYYERQSQGKSIHSPRNCLPGAGWEILRSGSAPVTVDGTPHILNRYVLKNGASTAVVYYWYQGRGRIVANEYAVKWNLLRDAALAGHTEEALVRIVIPVTEGPVSDATMSTGGFAAADSLGLSVAARLIQDVRRVMPASGNNGRPRQVAVLRGV